MAAGEGFEPSQTESESVVLPLHNPAIWCLPQYIITKAKAIIPWAKGFVKGFFTKNWLKKISL